MLAERFKVPEAKVQVYLGMGRVKARAQVDETVAQTLAGQLEKLGAVVTIERTPADEIVKLVTPPPMAPPPAQAYESGLAAAFSGVPAPPTMGAIDAVDTTDSIDTALTLSKLDGAELTPPPMPQRDRLTARPDSEPETDERFMPGDEENIDTLLPVAPAVPVPRKGTLPPTVMPGTPAAAALRKGTLPPTVMPGTPAAAALRKGTLPPTVMPGSPAAAAAARREATRPDSREDSNPDHRRREHSNPDHRRREDSSPDHGRLEQSRPDHPRVVDPEQRRRANLRFVGGLGLALVLGFAAAQIYGSIAEEKYDRIRAEIGNDAVPSNQLEYQLAVDRWQITVDRLHRAHTNVATTATLIWLLAGGAVALVYFKSYRVS